MTIPVIDPFNITTDPNLSFLTEALNPIIVQQKLTKTLPQPLQKSNLCAIRVIRHKPGRRCLIEYDLTNPNHSTIPITLIGKIRAKSTDLKSYQLNQTLWQKGFTDNSNDGISIPEPIALIPDFQMWLQRKVPGVTATKLLPQPQGIPLAKRIAEAIYKLHQAKIPPQRRHTLADELRILHQRLSLVAQLKPQWETRLKQILEACDRVAAMTPEPQLLGIHRDFYPDQIIVDGTRLYLLDLDLYCQGNPGLDLGNFIGHITEQSLRTLGHPEALVDRENALAERFIQLTSEAIRPAIESYTTLTLVRHIYISTQFPERCSFTESLLELCEQRLAKDFNFLPM